MEKPATEDSAFIRIAPSFGLHGGVHILYELDRET